MILTDRFYVWRSTVIAEPIYQRESGQWGNPNPFFESYRRYVPFVVLLALVPAICSSLNQANTYSLRDFSLSTLIFCLTFISVLGGIVLSWIGVYLAPAVTIPSLSYEFQQGSWDLLRLTPFTGRQIVMAKFLGSLKRLRIWVPLTALCLVQGLIFCMVFIANGEWFAGVVGGISVAFRPGLDVFFAGLAGMYVATWVKSNSTALALTYGVVIFVKILSYMLTIFSSWIFIITGFSQGSLSVVSLILPMLIYLILDIFGLILLPGRADRIALSQA